MILKGNLVYPIRTEDGETRKELARGKVVFSPSPVSFLGGVDPETGRITENDPQIRGKSIAGKIFVFPTGRGSTVGSYVMYALKKNGKHPLAIINRKSEIIVTVGAIISEIPLVDGIDPSVFMEGDDVSVWSDGSVEIHGVDSKDAVTVILTHKDRILLLKRSQKVGTCQGKWAGVSGHIESTDESPEERALIEVMEETGMSVTLKGRAEMIRVRDGDAGRIWNIHPMLAEVDDAEVTRLRIEWEHEEYIWVRPEDVENYETVPKLVDVLRSLGLIP